MGLFKIIKEDHIAKSILDRGFEHLGELNPFSQDMDDIVFSRSLSIDESQCVWLVYKRSLNGMYININKEAGCFDINPIATPFATICCRTDFLQINVPIMSFNHIEAFRCWENWQRHSIKQ